MLTEEDALHEETPLLAQAEALESGPSSAGLSKHDKQYNRFSPSQKRAIVGLLSWVGLLPFLASGSFVPSVPEIARELNSTGPVINLAITLSIICAALGGLVWATYSGTYGRRPIYLCSLPCLCVGSIGVALAYNVPSLMFWRVIQAFGASSGLSVGAGAISDMYRLEERGQAMGIFFGASLFGPAIAPVAGGLAAHYASWRLMQWALFLMGLAAYILVLFWFPETLDPEVAKEKFRAAGGVEGRRFVWLNPVKSLALLRSPNILIVTLAGSTTFLTDYALLIPLSFTIGKAYNITNAAIIGMFFLASGVGNIVGAPIAGYYADQAVIKGRARHAGQWVPEDRLRATLFGALVLVPFSVLISGLATQFIPGALGITINVACLFANGVAVDLVLTPSSSYYVDILHSRSAEVWAASSAVRQFSVALATAGILPLINAVGVAAADAIFAVVAWFGFLLIVLTIRYGDRMRAWVDVGYSTAETN
ncbi:MFS general substrate transporter [Trametes versicolor FP-101664 SS1]|uniref:MFS general substrate transporter n=1 Tax=Trametes versicolor (strain FP-101664) TaxID=717944 RepID=UPI0004622C2E|nr:MFS general substrate transporter [Trametes versicolor FP-101664 SS1]EIW61033.1 MFS general substrate transporter [Trametes versicolor FP-101664 SS1]